MTGLPLPLLLFRLAVVPLTLLFIAQLVLAGRALTGRLWVGAVAAWLILLVGEADFQPWYSFPFVGFFVLDVWLSPTFLLGLVFFVPAITLLIERFSSGESVRAAWKRWLLLGIFLLGCGGAKATILSVILGALVLTIAARWWTTRRIGANALTALASVTGTFLLFYLAIYRHSALGLEIDPLGTIRAMPWVSELRASIGDAAGWPLGVVLGVLGLFGAQLAGLPVLIALRRRSLDERRLFLLALFVTGLGPLLLTHQLGNSQVFFSHYGLVAGVLLAAEGIVLLAAGWRGRLVARSAAVITGVTAAALIVLVYAIQTRWWITFHPERKVAVLVLLVTFFFVLWRWSAPSGRRTPVLAAAYTGTTALLLILWRLHWSLDLADTGYIFAAVLVTGGALAVVLTHGSRRRELTLMLVVAIAALGAVDLPLDYGPDAINRLQTGAPFFDVYKTGLNRGLYEGLSWIRTNTSEDAVLAVNNYYERVGGRKQPTYFSYGAFAERRVFLQGWLSSAKSWNIGGEDVFLGRKTPFPIRLRLNNAVFQHADRRALTRLVHDFGVRYLVVDNLQGRATPGLAQLGRVTFENRAVTIYAVGPARATA